MVHEDDLLCVVDTDKVCLNWVHHWVLRVFCAFFVFRLRKTLCVQFKEKLSLSILKRAILLRLEIIGDTIVMWV